MLARRSLLGILTLLGLGLLLTGCFKVETRHRMTPKALGTRSINAPIRAHLLDGSVILFEKGLYAKPDTIWGRGMRYDLTRTIGSEQLWYVAIDSIVGMEFFRRESPPGRTFGEVVVASTTYVPAGLFLLKVVFGSCPTVYSGTGDDKQLEAECFSHSISPMFERADMDRMSVVDTSSGPFSLELQNEALETHYIDQMKLGFVDHPKNTEVHSINDDETVVVGEKLPLISARNSDRKSVLHELSYRDGNAYWIDSSTAHRMLYTRKRDHIELKVVVPKGQDEIALVMRGRNTLQNTVLFYDVMMRDQGISALDWTEEISSNYLTAWRIHRWFEPNTGVQVSVKNGDKFEWCGKVRETGPIAWKTAAVIIPVENDTATIRLSFVPDSWSIDWVELRTIIESGVEPTFVETRSVVRHQAKASNGDSLNLANDDGEYMLTHPGESMTLNYDLPQCTTADRTFFMRSKGYYIEWVRPEWVDHQEPIREFDPTEPEAIRARTTELWLKRKNSFEEEFFKFKVPITAGGLTK